MDDVQLKQCERNIIEQLESVWQLPREVSTDTLKHITEMVLSLPETTKVIGLQKLAEYAMSVMNLHILSLLDLFQRQADIEGISSYEQKETLAQVVPAIFNLLNALNRNHISISSLDDLATFSSIVLSLHTLSQSESADEAQSWLYELPATYKQQLTEEHLLVTSSKFMLTTENDSYYVALDPSDITPVTQKGNVILPFNLKQSQDTLPYIA